MQDQQDLSTGPINHLDAILGEFGLLHAYGLSFHHWLHTHSNPFKKFGSNHPLMVIFPRVACLFGIRQTCCRKNWGKMVISPFRCGIPNQGGYLSTHIRLSSHNEIKTTTRPTVPADTQAFPRVVNVEQPDIVHM